MFSPVTRRAAIVLGSTAALAAGATGVAVAASSSSPAPATTPAPAAAAKGVCSPERVALRQRLRTAIVAERKQEGHKLDGATRVKIAKPILDDAVQAGTIKQQAEDRILKRLSMDKAERHPVRAHAHR